MHIDQAEEFDVDAMPVTNVRTLIRQYAAVNSGVPAHPDEAPSAEQLAGLRSKLDADMAPYADFGVFRPHGMRLSRSLKFSAKIWLPESCSYVQREIPGPATWEDWRRSWRVYRFSMVVLGAVTPPVLDRYFERVQGLWASHGRLGGQGL